MRVGKVAVLLAVLLAPACNADTIKFTDSMGTEQFTVPHSPGGSSGFKTEADGFMLLDLPVIVSASNPLGLGSGTGIDDLSFLSNGTFVMTRVSGMTGTTGTTFYPEAFFSGSDSDPKLVDGTFVSLDGFEVVSIDPTGVPEPSTAMMLVAGLLIAVRFRRKLLD